MTEHEKLKDICDIIKYIPKFEYITKVKNDCCSRYVKCEGFFAKESIYEEGQIGDNYIEADVREIIFTQEFMDKLQKHHGKNIVTYETYEQKILELVLKHLEDPVSYLYNLLGLGTGKKL